MAGTIAKERAASGTGNGTVNDDAAEELAASVTGTVDDEAVGEPGVLISDRF